MSCPGYFCVRPAASLHMFNTITRRVLLVFTDNLIVGDCISDGALCVLTNHMVNRTTISGCYRLAGCLPSEQSALFFICPTHVSASAAFHTKRPPPVNPSCQGNKDGCFTLILRSLQFKLKDFYYTTFDDLEDLHHPRSHTVEPAALCCRSN